MKKAELSAHLLKRLLSAALSLALCFGVILPTLTVAAQAASSSTVTFTYEVTYQQSMARSVAELVNDFRTGDDAWYWNSDNTTQTVLSDLSELTYDYDLEAAAMQRAAEIALSFSHTRTDGGSSSDVLAEISYSYTAYGEILLPVSDLRHLYSKAGQKKMRVIADRAIAGICWEVHTIKSALAAFIMAAPTVGSCCWPTAATPPVRPLRMTVKQR